MSRHRFPRSANGNPVRTASTAPLRVRRSRTTTKASSPRAASAKTVLPMRSRVAGAGKLGG